ncbi:jg6040 [Pararge aegeria aegeria]|uniref:Jg6040 protein n=1 Tax=Pararge aegeria aegeria TaxID=348720 RepID=A0A8S4QDV3_9NEOP|nr:jg6040 [Pararge aegeria aegeria]
MDFNKTESKKFTEIRKEMAREGAKGSLIERSLFERTDKDEISIARGSEAMSQSASNDIRNQSNPVQTKDWLVASRLEHD